MYVFFNAFYVFECTTYKISSKTQLSSYLQSLIPFVEKTTTTTIKKLFIHLDWFSQESMQYLLPNTPVKNIYTYIYIYLYI